MNVKNVEFEKTNVMPYFLSMYCNKKQTMKR